MLYRALIAMETFQELSLNNAWTVNVISILDTTSHTVTNGPAQSSIVIYATGATSTSRRRSPYWNVLSVCILYIIIVVTSTNRALMVGQRRNWVTVRLREASYQQHHHQKPLRRKPQLSTPTFRRSMRST